MVTFPQSWLAVQLGDVVPYGKTEKCELSDVTGDTWILELEDIEKDSSKIIQRLDATARPFKSTKNKFSKGDVLYGKLRPYLNKVVIADNSGVCSTEIIPLNAEPYIDNRYLFYWLKSKHFLDFVNSVSYGVNMPRLGTKDGLVAPFVVAPLAEQKIIADKLDTLLTQVENTKTNLERVHGILKTFRQSVLTAAVSGKLTEEWRELNNQSLDMWKVGPLGDFIEKPTYGSSAKSQPEGLIPVLRMGNLQDGNLDWSNLVYTSDPEEIKKYTLSAGDVLFNRTNSPELVGKTSIFRGEREAVYAGYLIRIRCKENLNPEFLNYLLNSPDAKDYCYQVKSDGVSQSNINAQKIKAYIIRVPTIIEQTEIVRRIVDLFTFADSIKQKTNTALDRLHILTQSIMAKAFHGELTADWRADNLDLITGDNSAKTLLKKIKAKREAIERQPKPIRSAIKMKTGNDMSKEIIKVVEALERAGEPLSGQQLLTAAGYPNDSSTEQLEQFFLDIRDALTIEESIVKLKRGNDCQDWFALANPPINNANKKN
ncbi:restriction endonuclease subunit S [Aeromonas jandaei]|uniref:restriction endonuclease subunit S n=1 Tax=Aeromonas jandaei TaxID=650 RepID=UPI003BA2EFC8